MIDYVKDYGMESGMSPDSFYDLAKRILNNSDLARQFKWDTDRRAPEKPTTVDQKKLYCMLSSSETQDESVCNDTGFFSDIGKKIVDAEIGDWVKELYSKLPSFVQ